MSKIEWTGHTWNPVTGCVKVSDGCTHCYAETFAERWRGTPGHAYEHGFDIQLRPERLRKPLNWRQPSRVFVNSMSDLFIDDVPDDFIAHVFAVMAATPQHTYQVLTKRPARMRSLMRSDAFRLLAKEHYGQMKLEGLLPGLPLVINAFPPRNVWLGVSVEDQRWADIRVPVLIDTPAAVRFLSCEPLLGPVDLTALQPHVCGRGPGGVCERWIHGIDWVIAGGESGPGARPMHPRWAADLRDACAEAQVPFFFKQWGEWVPAPSNYGPDVPERARRSTRLVFAGKGDVDGQIMLRAGKARAGRELDGRTHDDYPGGTR